MESKAAARYDLVLCGCEDPKAAYASLMANFGLTDDESKSLLERVPIVIKRNATGDEVDSFARALERGTLSVEVRKKASPVESAEPNKTSRTLNLNRFVKPVALLSVVCAIVLGAASLWPDPVTVHVAQEGRPGGNVLILLHSYGASGSDLMGLGKDLGGLGLPKDIRVLVPEGPFQVGMHGHAWSVDGNLDEAKTSIHHLLEGVHADAEVILAGFSQGAAVAEAMALEGDPKLAGVAVLSPTTKLKSWVHTENIPQEDLPNPKEQRTASNTPKTRLVSQMTLPALVTHGSLDAINPLEPMRDVYAALQKGDQSIRFVEFEGGHAMPAQIRKSLAVFVDEHLGGRPRIARLDANSHATEQ